MGKKDVFEFAIAQNRYIQSDPWTKFKMRKGMEVSKPHRLSGETIRGTQNTRFLRFDIRRSMRHRPN